MATGDQGHSETLSESLARIAEHHAAFTVDGGASETQAFIARLAGRYGLTTDERDSTEAPALEPDTDTDEANLEFTDDADGETAYWATALLALPLMPNERHGPCSLEVEAGVIAQAVLDGDWDLPTSAALHELREIAARGRDALNEMLEGNLRLALHWATRYSRRDVDRAQDLFQEAYFGLFRAIEGWDALRGYKFSTYATWHVRQSLQRGLALGASRYPVHIPIHVFEAISVSEKSGSELSETVQLGLDWIRGIWSWEQIAEEVPDLISLTDNGELNEMLERLDLESSTRQCLSLLDARLAEVLAARSGFGTGDQESLDHIGRRLGVTRERVRQLELKATATVRLHAGTQVEVLRKRVIAALRSSGDPLSLMAETAVRQRISSPAEIKKRMKVDSATAKGIVEVIESAVLGLQLDVSDLPRLWVDPGRPLAPLPVLRG